MTRLCVSVEFSLQKSNEMEVEYTLRGWTREGKKKLVAPLETRGGGMRMEAKQKH